MPQPVPPPPAVLPQSAAALVASDDSALVVPVEPVVEEPEEVLPQRARPAAPAKRAAPVRAVRPGELVCGECGEGNQPTRKFCARCGESLASAVTAKTPWWRRLRLRRGPRMVSSDKRPTTAAPSGNRTAGRRFVLSVRRYAFVAVLLFGFMAAVYPPLRTYVTTKAEDARAGVARLLGDATLSPTRPAAIRPTATETQGHPASAAFDQFTNTHWSAPWGPNLAQPAVTVDLGKPTGLAKVIVTSGASDDFAAHHRPSILLLAYSNEKSDTVTLRDTPDPQELTLRNGVGAQLVKVQVLQVFETGGAEDVALTELEFFGVG